MLDRTINNCIILFRFGRKNMAGYKKINCKRYFVKGHFDYQLLAKHIQKLLNYLYPKWGIDKNKIAKPLLLLIFINKSFLLY